MRHGRPFPQYSDYIFPGFADERFRAAISHDLCELLHGFGAVVSAMRPQIAFVGDANSTTREVFVRGQRSGGAWVHCAKV